MRALLACALLLALAPPARAEEVRRVAVLAGANGAAPGRRPLRYAHRDAQRMADVLARSGGFAAADVHVLLDPTPRALLTTLEQAQATLGPRGVLVFYYSGHADAEALYPSGQPLALSQLKARLDGSAATVTLGIIDACRGGGWTQAKGLAPGPPFQVQVPLELASEGSILVSASSGLEAAHEAEALEGSFFTHHLVAGLSGAADQSGDGEVSVTEAFDYARALTVRDTALVPEGPQHPSFQTRLRGRQDLVLTRVGGGSTLLLEQRDGPLELISLPSGARVLELVQGPRAVTLSVPPGRYLVVRRATVGGGGAAREVTVSGGQPARVTEESLLGVGSRALAAKGPGGVLVSQASTVPKHRLELRLGAGVTHSDSLAAMRVPGWFDPYLGTSTKSFEYEYIGREQLTAPATQLSAILGLSDRLQVSLPALAVAYRLGEVGATEWIPWAGALRWQLTTQDFSYQVGAGVDARHWLGLERSLNFGLRTKSGGAVRFGQQQRLSPDTWIAEVVVGYSHTLGERVTLNLCAAAALNVTYQGRLPRSGAALDEQGFGVALGSVLERGLRPLPLVSVQLTDELTVDLYASIRKKLLSGDFYETYQLGFSWTL